jgi:hypothetical protein
MLDNAFQLSIRFEKRPSRLYTPCHGPLKGGINFFNGELITVGSLAAQLFLIPAKVQRGDRDLHQRALVCFQTVMNMVRDNTGSGTATVCLKHF